MNYSAAVSLAAIATFSTTGMAIAHHQPPEAVTQQNIPAAVIYYDVFPDKTRNRTITWETSAKTFNLRGHLGQTFSFYCPPGIADQVVWGTDIYTDDSSICTAAVHAGIITAATGGNVSFNMLNGHASYVGSDRHGVITRGYDAWDGSFEFTKTTITPTLQTPTPQTSTIQWNDNLLKMGLSRTVDAVYRFFCPAGGAVNSSVWGTDTYTDDSALCKAAVHAGEITLQEGGTITVQVTSGEVAYIGSDRNGIKTSDYGAWGKSFVFIREK